MNKKFLIGGGLVAVAVVAVAVWFLFLKDDAPDVVSNDAANADLDAVLGADDETTDDQMTDDETTDDTPVGIDGVWVIDDEIGEFDFDTASGSFAGFRVAEELTIGEVTAVGRSGNVTGSVTITEHTERFVNTLQGCTLGCSIPNA